jgi:SanA protein
MKRFPWKKLAGLILLLFLFVLVGANLLIPARSQSRIYHSVDTVPPAKVAVVLGTSKYLPGGRTNLYYRYRIEAAAALYHRGKVRFLLLSGDNSQKDYDEPTQMKNDLIAAGVPPDRLYLDFAGFRTLDSILRAKHIFGLTEAIVVSQQFHLERAIFLGDAHGLRLTGLAARDVSGRNRLRVQVREVAARVMAVWDVFVGRRAKFAGETILLPS